MPVLYDDLLAAWEFDTASGLLVEVHNGKNLTANGAPSGVSGKLSEAGHADDFEDFFSRPHESALATGAGAWTIVGWGRFPDGGEGVENALIKFDTAFENADYAVYFGGSATEISLQAGKVVSGNGAAATASASANVNNWFFYAGKFDPATGTFYARVNGGAWQTHVEALEWATLTDGDIIIMGSGNPFATEVDALRLYGRLLSDAEVDYHYNAGAGRTYAELAEYGASSFVGSRRIGNAIGIGL